MKHERRDRETRSSRLDTERQRVSAWLSRVGSTLEGGELDALVERVAEENVRIMFRRDENARGNGLDPSVG
jgi:hypothetical protein